MFVRAVFSFTLFLAVLPAGAHDLWLLPDELLHAAFAAPPREGTGQRPRRVVPKEVALPQAGLSAHVAMP
jgi:hypothetical protein